MPLLFRKRGSRAPPAPAAPPDPPKGSRSSRSSRSPHAPRSALGSAPGSSEVSGVDLATVWDLPSPVSEHGELDDEPELITPRKEHDNRPRAVPKTKKGKIARGKREKNHLNNAADMIDHAEQRALSRFADLEGENALLAERLRGLERALAGLQRAERSAQEAVLGLRREIIQHEHENARLHATLGDTQVALESYKAAERSAQEAMNAQTQRIQELEAAEAAYKEHIDTLREKLNQLEEQQQYQEQQQQQYQQQMEPKPDLHTGYNMEDMMAYGQYPMAYGTLGAAGPGVTDFSYTMHPGHPGAGHPVHAVHPTHPLQLQHPTRKDGNQLHHMPPVNHPHMQRIRAKKKAHQCYKCQKFGHDARECSGETTCLVCAGRHSHKDCTVRVYRCANCQGQHRASSKECPAWRMARLAHAAPPEAT